MKTNELIDAIHASAWQGVIAVTGGGSGALSALLGRPGASATLLEAVVPYCETALVELIKFKPEQACSEPTARQMAMASFQRAQHLTNELNQPKEINRSLFGLGATASLATNRPKRGDHRLYVAIQTFEQTISLSIQLDKGVRTRTEEESIASHAILVMLAQVTGIRPMDLTKSPPCMEAKYCSSEVDPTWSPLLLEPTYGVQVEPIEITSRDETPKLIFPGAFNPLHEGHRQMASVAESITGSPAWFELSLRNVDKPPLDFLELIHRLESFGKDRVLLTNAPTFVEKAKLYPGCQFIVGADTLLRIGQTRYYPGDISKRDEALASIQRAGCRFLAFGRLVEEEFCTSHDLDIPAALAEITDMVPPEQFRCDLSSTELRGESLADG